MPAGRPTQYQEGYPELLLDHFRQGLSFESFGGLIGVAKQTLYNWLDAHPEFMDAKKVGEMASLLEWEKKGITGLYNETFKDDDGMTVSRSINSTIWIFNMKNRFGWRDKTSHELSGVDGKPIETVAKSELTDEEIDSKIRSLLGAPEADE